MADTEEFIPLTSSSLTSDAGGTERGGRFFITSSSSSPEKTTTNISTKTTNNGRTAKTSASGTAWTKVTKIFLLILFIVSMMFLYNHELTKFNNHNCSVVSYPSTAGIASNDDATVGANRVGHGATTVGPRGIICPSQLNEARNDQTLKWYKDNVKVQNKTVAWTVDQVENLKKEKIDGWKRNYHQLKAFKKDWKVRHFSSLKSGDSIFESACGKGINLLFTVELLKEQLGIENLQVSGIEYRQDAAVIADSMLRTALPMVGSQVGSICQADATNLSFIPSETFDLSYTGYIEPLEDPLNIGKELGRELKFEDVCNQENNWARNKLRILDQNAQEDWYAAWVKELVRITKRGKPIVIEEISLPMCENEYDWGGVKKDWWREAAIKYKWDVDVDSIYIEGLKKSDEDSRYNLFMRKIN
jgi:hypothetical protein